MSDDFYDEQVRRMFFKQTMSQSLERDSQMQDTLYDNNVGSSWTHPNGKVVEKAFVKEPNAINPPHYQNVAAGLQYMELMVDMLANKSGIEAHLFGQVYKYMMRCGKKDKSLQELEKAQWYLNALVNYTRDGDLGIEK